MTDIDYGNGRKSCVVYSEERKWFFVHIPKNGGTSFIEKYKSINIDPENKFNLSHKFISFNENHNTASYFTKLFPEFASYTPVSIVRNPWSRCLSLYTFSLKNCIDKKNFGKEWTYYIHTRLTMEGFKQSWMPNGFFRDENNMQNGIAHNPKRNWREDDPQNNWLTEKTKWFKLETQLEDLYDFTGLDKTSMKDVKNPTSHYDYRLYYDEELKNEIAELYKEDIEKFGYTF